MKWKARKDSERFTLVEGDLHQLLQGAGDRSESEGSPGVFSPFGWANWRGASYPVLSEPESLSKNCNPLGQDDHPGEPLGGSHISRLFGQRTNAQADVPGEGAGAHAIVIERLRENKSLQVA